MILKTAEKMNLTALTGAIIFPVWPTCRSFGTNPASTAALEAPTAAFSLSAKSYNNLKLSPDFNPLPEKLVLSDIMKANLKLNLFLF